MLCLNKQHIGLNYKAPELQISTNELMYAVEGRLDQLVKDLLNQHVKIF
jgi:hypothetical protein